MLTPLANKTAVAIENARLYEAVAANEHRLEKEVRFAQRVQRRCCRRSCRSGCAASTWRRASKPRASSAATLHDFLTPEPNGLVVAVGDVSGKGVPAALYSAFAGELVRGRTYRRRYTSVQSSPAGVLAAMNNILNERQLEEYYCTLCYASFDFKRRLVRWPIPACRIRSAAPRKAAPDRSAGGAARLVRRHHLRRGRRTRSPRATSS